MKTKRPAPLKTRRSLELTPAKWARLESLARRHKCLSAGGPKFGKPSWRVLIDWISSDKLTTKASKQP